MLFKLNKKLKKSYKELVENNIYGIDIDPHAIKRTKILFSLIVYEKEGVIPKKFNIYNGNSLDKNFLKEVLKDEKFDCVVGNPPYVRIQNLDEKTKKIIKSHWRFVHGDTDLFIPFIELGIELLKPEGKMGYITPNSYFTSYAGKELREFLQSKKLIEEIVDFDYYQIFEGITTYTAIIIISNKEKKYFWLKKMENYEEVKNLEKVKKEKIYYKHLNPTKWILLTKKDTEFIQMIERAPYKLNEIADIRVGLATLADKIYIIDEPFERENFFIKILNGKEFLIEKEITKEIIKVSIIKTEEDIEKNKRRIIFPYKNINGKYVIFPEEELKLEYPKVYQYLEFCKEILLKRDKGKKVYDSWYAFGRSQGINTTFGKKLLTPPMALKPTFVVCEKEEATYYSGYGIFPKIEPYKDLYLLKIILNSQLVQYYIEKTSKSYQGGWKSYSKTFLENIGLPKLNENQIKEIKSETNQNKVNEILKEIYYGQSKHREGTLL